MAITQDLEALSDPALSDTQRAVLEGKVKAQAVALNDPQILSSTLSSIASARSTSRADTKIAATEAVSSGMTREQFIQKYGPEDAIQYDIAKAQSLNARASIEASEQAVLDTEFSEAMQALENQFEVMMARPSDAIDEQAAINLQNQMVDLAQKAGKPVSGYTELFSSRLQQKIADEIDAEDQARLIAETQEKQWADSTVQAVIRSGSEDPLAALASRIESVTDPKIQALYDKHLTYIKKGVEDHFQAVDEISESFKTGQPSATAIDFLSDPANANYFEGLDAAENALAEIKKLNKKVADGGTLNANDRTIQRASVKIINDEVAKARNARRKQETSEPVAEINAEKQLINTLLSLRNFKFLDLKEFFMANLYTMLLSKQAMPQ